MATNKSKMFNDFFRHNLQCQDSLENLRDILRRSFGIDDFWHLTVYENGHMANVSTNYEQWGAFYENEGYKWGNFLIAPSRLRDAVFHLEYDAEFSSFTDTFKDTYPQYHPFMIIRKEEDKAHIFGFAARQYRPSLPSFYVNNLALLNSFLDYYLSSNVKFTRHREENMIDIAKLRGHKHFYNSSYGTQCLVEPSRDSPFFRQIGIDPTLLGAAKKLSLREKQVLTACYDGKTALQNGQQLGLSHRTVEFYLDNAKNKLGLFSREELMQSVGILKMAGFLG